MSGLDHRWAPRLSTQPTFQRLTKILFGDRIGVVIFLAALAFTTLYWRVGFFINDNYTIANTLVNIAEGHLHITPVIYGPDSGATPGMKLMMAGTGAIMGSCLPRCPSPGSSRRSHTLLTSALA